MSESNGEKPMSPNADELKKYRFVLIETVAGGGCVVASSDNAGEYRKPVFACSTRRELLSWLEKHLYDFDA